MKALFQLIAIRRNRKATVERLSRYAKIQRKVDADPLVGGWLKLPPKDNTVYGTFDPLPTPLTKWSK